MIKSKPTTFSNLMKPVECVGVGDKYRFIASHDVPLLLAGNSSLKVNVNTAVFQLVALDLLTD